MSNITNFPEDWNIFPIKQNSKIPVGNWKSYKTEKCPRNKIKNHKIFAIILCLLTTTNVFSQDKNNLGWKSAWKGYDANRQPVRNCLRKRVSIYRIAVIMPRPGLILTGMGIWSFSTMTTTGGRPMYSRTMEIIVTLTGGSRIM